MDKIGWVKHERYGYDLEFFLCLDENAAVWQNYKFGDCLDPTNYILDRDGNVIYRKSGYFEEDVMYQICQEQCSAVNSESWGAIKAGFTK